MWLALLSQRQFRALSFPNATLAKHPPHRDSFLLRFTWQDNHLRTSFPLLWSVLRYLTSRNVSPKVIPPTNAIRRIDCQYSKSKNGATITELM